MMQIPPYWTRAEYTETTPSGHSHSFMAYGWSFEDIHDAHQTALERARRIFDFYLNNELPDHYSYGTSPIRESIIETFGDAGQPSAVITRNRYGSLILNTSGVMFVDIDFPEVSPRGLLDAILLLFSSQRHKQRRIDSIQQSVESTIDWGHRNPDHSFRLYRTHSGLRLLFTNGKYSPVSDEVATIFDQLGSDPLYQRLTRQQECFRARLTPKPWRCQSDNPPNQFPWLNDVEQSNYQDWVAQYEQKCSGHKTCELLDVIGEPDYDDTADQVVSLHDEYTCGNSGDRLA